MPTKNTMATSKKKRGTEAGGSCTGVTSSTTSVPAKFIAARKWRTRLSAATRLSVDSSSTSRTVWDWENQPGTTTSIARFSDSSAT